MRQSEGHRLSFRTSETGGDVRELPDERELDSIRYRSNLVLLIHGYNNDEAAAVDAYRGFERIQRELSDAREDEPIFDGNVVKIYWPGDADWGAVSFLYYMKSIDQAKRTAVVLANALKTAIRENGNKFIDIIAHSMGCRLTLELIKQLKDEPGAVVRRIVLMAGAVPVYMLDGHRDKHGLREAYDAKLSEGALSLYSLSDMVLGFAFPAGQSLAGEGFLPVALGHDVWMEETAPPNLSQAENLQAGHSDYWGWNSNKPVQGRFANERVRSFLQQGRAGSREITPRLSTERNTADERQPVADRQVPDRFEQEWWD